MKTSLICLTIAICAELIFEGVAQTVEMPHAWLRIFDHDHAKAAVVQEITTNPCYTDIVSQYKPVVRKLDYGKWEITFESEIAEGLP